MPTVTDGAWFSWSGTTFQVETMKGGVPATVTSFNGNLGATYDPGTTVKTYEIYWTNSKVYFVIGDVILHTVSASSATWANTMSYHAFADSVNSGVALSVTMAIRVMTISRLGKPITQPQYYYFANGQTAGTNIKLGPGNLHSMIVNTITNNSTATLADSNKNHLVISYGWSPRYSWAYYSQHTPSSHKNKGIVTAFSRYSPAKQRRNYHQDKLLLLVGLSLNK